MEGGRSGGLIGWVIALPFSVGEGGAKCCCCVVGVCEMMGGFPVAVGTGLIRKGVCGLIESRN